MIYYAAGLLASALMLLYRRPVARTSPLRQLSIPSDALAARLEGRGSRATGTFALVASFSVLTVVASLRYGIGTDYLARYVPMFIAIRQGAEVDVEPGYLVLNQAVASVTDEYQWLFVVVSVLTIALVYRFIVRMSLNPALSVFLFVFGGFYLEAFNLGRQGLAVAILLNTVEFVMRRKQLGFVLLTLLAASMHLSALVWFAVWPLMWVRLNRFWRIFLTVAIAAVVYLVPELFGSLVGQVAPEYAWYFQSNYGGVRLFDPGGVAIAVILFVLSAIFLRGGPGDRYTTVVVNLQAFLVAILAATLFVAYAFSRLTYYFAPILLLALPLLLSKIHDRLVRRLAMLVIMVALVAVFQWKFIEWRAHEVWPYVWIFDRP